jgi:hypothetical protein
MTAKSIITIALFFLAMTTLLAQKTIKYELYVSSAIVSFAHKNTLLLPNNHQIIAKTPLFTEGGNAVKVQLHLDKKNTHNAGSFPVSFVLDTDKKPMVQGGCNVVKYLSLFGHFDSDRGAGGGLTITY